MVLEPHVNPDVSGTRKRIAEYVTLVKQKYPTVDMSDRLAREIGNEIRQLKLRSPLKDIISPRLIEGVQSAVKARARMEHRQVAKDEDWKYVREIRKKLYM